MHELGSLHLPPKRTIRAAPILSWSFHSRCRPPLMKSFIMSYLEATLLNTSATSDCFFSLGTSLKPTAQGSASMLQIGAARASVVVLTKVDGLPLLALLLLLR